MRLHAVSHGFVSRSRWERQSAFDPLQITDSGVVGCVVGCALAHQRQIVLAHGRVGEILVVIWKQTYL